MINESTGQTKENDRSNNTEEFEGTEEAHLEQRIASAFSSLTIDEQSEPSSEFVDKCLRSAGLARMILSIRKTRSRHDKIDDRSLEDYLSACVAPTDLSQLRTSLGIADFSGRQPLSGIILGELAHDVDMSLEETLIRLRIGLIGARQLVPLRRHASVTS